jgi:hypothetical protein
MVMLSVLLNWTLDFDCYAPSGPFLVSRTGDVGWTKREVKVPDFPLMRPHKRCWLILTAGRWPWKSETAKECVTTHLPNQLALKMDGARAEDLYFAVVEILNRISQRVGRLLRWRWRRGLWSRLEPSWVQILVEVANIQVRSLKTEVEKGSACTVIVRGLVGPKAQANAGLKWKRSIYFVDCVLRAEREAG